MLTPAVSEIIRRTGESLLNPILALFSLFFVLLIYILTLKNKQRIIQGIVFIVLVLFCLISTAWLPRCMVYVLERQYPAVTSVDPHIHWVVVLGGGVFELSDLSDNEALSEASIKRLLEGIRLYRALPDAKLILSGGSLKKPQYSVAIRMQKMATWFGIPLSHLVLESNSVNTADEALEIKKMIGDTPFYLVTDAMHMPRSMRLFQHAGLHPNAAPCHYVYFWKRQTGVSVYLPNIYNMMYVSVAWHEILGLAWGKFRGIL